MRVFCYASFRLPLPAHHRFPAGKYAALRARVDAWGRVRPELAPAATDADILRAHTPAYLEKVTLGTLSRAEQAATGLPWSPELALRARRSVGATLAACRAALEDGVAASLAGGTHHAHADRGEGFCVFNDTVIAVHAMRAERRAGKVLVIDCDVHQGDGTAALLAGDARSFTLSLHAASNYPFTKQASDLDVPLADRTGDGAYLRVLEDALTRAFARFQPELAIYVSGADAYDRDRLGKLSLSKKGLARRDRLVFETCRERGVPVALTMGGGYADPIEDTVDIHFATLREAWRARHRARPGADPAGRAPAGKVFSPAA